MSPNITPGGTYQFSSVISQILIIFLVKLPMYMHVAVAIVPSYLLVNWLTAIRGYCTNHCG